MFYGLFLCVVGLLVRDPVIACKYTDVDSCSINIITRQMDRIEMNFNSVKSLIEYERQELTQLKDDLKRLHCNKPAPAVCEKGWFQHDSKCYYISGETKTWQEAKEKCAQMKAILVEIHDQKTDLFLKKTLSVFEIKSRNFHYFTGGSDAEKHGHYVWNNSGKPFGFTDWGRNEPGGGREHCIALASHDSYRFHDFTCSKRLGYICEKRLA